MPIEEAELRITLRAIATELLAGMEQARVSVDRATSSIRGDFKKTEETVARSSAAIGERVTVGFSGIQGQIRAFGELAQAALVVVGAYRAVKDITEANVEWAESTKHLSVALQGSAEDTAALAVAAKESNLPIERLDILLRGLGLHINQNEAEFKNLGIRVRDTVTGNIRPSFEILKDIVAEIQTYHGSADRLIVGQRLLGRGADPETIEGLRKTIANFNEAKQTAKEFGLVVGEDGVVQAEKFTKAQADLGFALLAVKNQIGGALRPEIEKVLLRIRELAQNGGLVAWAKEAGASFVGVGESVIELTEFLVDQGNTIQTLAVAWAAYRAGLIATAEWEAVVTFLNRIREGVVAIGAAQGVSNLALGISQAAKASLDATAAMRGVTLATGAAGAAWLNFTVAESAAAEAAVSTAGALGVLEGAVDSLLVALGPAGIVAVVISAGIALLSFSDRWDIVTNGVRRFGQTLHDVIFNAQRDIDSLNVKDIDDDIRNLLASTANSTGTHEDRLSPTDAARLAALRAQREAKIGRDNTKDADAEARRSLELDSKLEESRRFEGGASVEGGAGASFGDTKSPPPPPPDKGIPPDIQQQIAAEKDAFDKLKQKRDDDYELYRADYAKRLKAAQDFYAGVQQLAEIRDPITKVAAKDTQVAEAQRSLTQAVRQNEEQQTRIVVEGLRERTNARLKAITEEEKLVGSKVELGTINVNRDAVPQLQALADERLAITLRLVEEERKQYAHYPEDLKRLDREALTAHDQWALDYAEIDRKAAKASLDEWRTTAKDISEAFSILTNSLKTYLTSLFTGTTSDVTGLRDELRAATRDVEYFNAINEKGTDDAINAKQREIDAQNQLNSALDSTSNKTQALAALQRNVLQGTLGLLGDILTRMLEIQAIKFLTGETPSTKGGTLQDQFAEAVLGKFTGGGGGGEAAKPESVPIPEIAGGVIGAGAAALPIPDSGPLLSAANQTEDQLTGIAKRGLTERQNAQGFSLTTMLGKLFNFTDSSTTTVAEGASTQAGAIVKGQASETAAIVSNEATQVAVTETAGKAKAASESDTAEKSLLASAISAAGKAYNAFADYGVVGVVLGAAAAAAVFAAVIAYKALLSFEVGGVVPETGPIIAHKGERVLNVEETREYDEEQRKKQKKPGAPDAVAADGATPAAPPLPTGTAPAPGGGTQPFVAAARGFDVPAGGALVQAHAGEHITPVDSPGVAATPTTPTEPVQDTKGKEDSKGDGKGEGKGKDDKVGDGADKAKGKLEALGEAASSAAIAAKGVGTGGSGTGGGSGIQKVSIERAPATLTTHVSKGSVTVSEPVGVQGDSGAPLPVQNQGIQQVAVVGTVRVTFALVSIGTSIETSIAPFGIGEITSIGFSTGYAFEKGGRVPSTGPHLLHEDEFVLPADAVRAIEAHGAPPGGGTLLDQLVSKLTGNAPSGVDPFTPGAAGTIQIGGPSIRPSFGSGATITQQAITTIHEYGPTIAPTINAIDGRGLEDALDPVMAHIADGVANQWARRPGKRSRP